MVSPIIESEVESEKETFLSDHQGITSPSGTVLEPLTSGPAGTIGLVMVLLFSVLVP